MSSIGTQYTVHVIEADPNSASLYLVNLKRRTFSYETGTVSTTTVKKAEKTAAANTTEGWIVVFNLIIGGTTITNSSTITQILSACSTAIAASYPGEISP